MTISDRIGLIVIAIILMFVVMGNLATIFICGRQWDCWR